MQFETIMNNMLRSLENINKINNLLDFPKYMIVNIDIAIVISFIMLFISYSIALNWIEDDPKNNTGEDQTIDNSSHSETHKMQIVMAIQFLFKFAIFVLILNVIIFTIDFSIGPKKQVYKLEDALLNLNHLSKEEKIEWYKSNACELFEKDFVTSMLKIKQYDSVVKYYKNKSDFLISEVTNQNNKIFDSEKLIDVSKENIKGILNTILSNL